MTKYLVLNAAHVGHLAFTTDRYYATNVYIRERRAGAAVGMWKVKGQDREIIFETPSYKELRLRPIAILPPLTESQCIRCAEPIPVSGTVPAVDLKGGPVCEACEGAEKAQARATWLKDAVRA